MKMKKACFKFYKTLPSSNPLADKHWKK